MKKRKRVVETKLEDIEIEMEPSLEGNDIYSYLSIWYGPPKIGKSTLLNHFDDVYFLVTEPGWKHLKLRKTKIYDWSTFKGFIKKATKNRSFLPTVNLFCIDPVDKLAKFCMDYVCAKRMIDHPSDQEWGKGWEAFRDEFAEWILKLCALGPGLACISHVKERDIISRDMTITKETPAMPKTCYTILNDLADLIVRIGYEPRTRKRRGKEQRRALFLRSTEEFEAGGRIGTLPKYIPFKTESEAVEKFMSYFEGGRKEKPAKKKKRSKKHSK